MKTAKEKAEEWIESQHLIYSDGMIESLALLLKQQDRDTRQACAEAVIQCNEDVSGECIWKDEAHSACMNVQAV